MTLNPEQARAVATNHPRVLVIAGAGAGKTKVLAERVRVSDDDLTPEGHAPDCQLLSLFRAASAVESP